MQRPTRFQIIGLFGNRNIDLPIADDALILVGPNGIGKSSVTNIFYFFVSRQWSRLTEYDFQEIIITFDGHEIRAARSDITGLSQLDKIIRSVPTSSRTSVYLDKLRNAGVLEDFVSSRWRASSSRDFIAHLLNLPPDEVRHFRMSILRRINSLGEDDLFSPPRVQLEKEIADIIPNRTLYLPTYRRIEKDIQEIFPDLEERLRLAGRAGEPIKFTRSAKHYIDLVSFGMEDVRSNIESKTRFLRDYSLAQFNALSGLYLRDVIKGTADRYSAPQIAKLDEESLSTILSRVSEQILSVDDKALLRSKILDIKGKRKSELETNDLYLAHYFSRLMTASEDISRQEVEITSFIDVCNAYLAPGKFIVYDDTTFAVKIVDDRDRQIDLSMLSSGEKQVVSLFSHLYLDNSKDQIVIIDEPELSLSVPWQKRFLPDILGSGRCSFIFAVTHSPFIYQNTLRHSAIDLRRRTSGLVEN